MIISHGPVRLLKLQFKKLEILLRQDIKTGDAEIDEECRALLENKDIGIILRRHEEKFKTSDFIKNCQSHLHGMRGYLKELVEKKIEDKTNMEETLEFLQNYWNNLLKKIETMNAKLTILPNAKDNFEKNTGQLIHWISEAESTSRVLNDNNISSMSEYRRQIEKCRVNFI